MSEPDYNSFLGPAGMLQPGDRLMHPGAVTIITVAHVRSVAAPRTALILATASGDARELRLPSDMMIRFLRPRPKETPVPDLTPADIPDDDRAAFEDALFAHAGILAHGSDQSRYEAVDTILNTALDIIAPLAVARLREQLGGEDHFVSFRKDGFTVEHPLSCRESGRMADCAWHRAIDEDDRDLGSIREKPGRWKIVSIAGGHPTLEYLGDPS